jgi:beta-phosphoglucomutase family hydrolase
MNPTAGGIDPQRHDAVLFDLDGVLTATAKIHAASWQEMFDEFLRKRATERGEPFRPFDISEDYLRYVDGKPRTSGVRDFLLSRGIELPEGTPEDGPDEETVHGLGHRKNRLVNELLASHGVAAYEGSVRLVRHLLETGIRAAVVSSSQNCEVVLRAAGIVDLFELWVDGGVAGRLGLNGKPAPDTFIEAARQLGVKPERAVVVEDAISGVQAGHAGGFGLVIGVARHGDAEELRKNGADFVVDDLGELVP